MKTRIRQKRLLNVCYAGLIAALITQGIDPTLAAAAGVHLHAVCGDRVASHLSQYGMLPSDMIGELPLLFQSINR